MIQQKYRIRENTRNCCLQVHNPKAPDQETTKLLCRLNSNIIVFNFISLLLYFHCYIKYVGVLACNFRFTLAFKLGGLELVHGLIIHFCWRQCGVYRIWILWCGGFKMFSLSLVSHKNLWVLLQNKKAVFNKKALHV